MNKNLLPKKWNYGEYESSNYGSHTIAIEIPQTRKNKHGITLYFSYNTIVAFSGFVKDKIVFVIHKNIWGNTTGKHLNWLDDDKSKRVDSETFEKLYKQALKNA